MQYDIILVIGELFFDHPLSGAGIIKRLLEKYGYSVGIIEQPQKSEDVCKLGKPRLFFGISSGTIDSMVRNYTPLKKRRDEDTHTKYDENVKDRAVIVYTNWVKQQFKDSIIVLGGTESTLRRLTHYDYWENRLRKPILFDAKADILVYGSGEKQIIEIAKKIKEKKPLKNILGTCQIVKDAPINSIILPSYQEIVDSKEKFVDAQKLLTNNSLLAQKIDNRYIVQHPSPTCTSKDLDEYYELPFTREVPEKLRGFEFSVITHRGCIGNCSFCALRLIQGDKIISRSEQSILKEIKNITKNPFFKGNIDDLGGPSANMYGMDCTICDKECINCTKLNRTNNRLINLLRKARDIEGVKHIYIRSGIRYDLATQEYVKELVFNGHIYDTLRIAPEHINPTILDLMNKNKGDLRAFIKFFNELNTTKELSYYFMTAHPGSTIKEAEELKNTIKKLKNAKDVQIFTPTPMTDSTCMYYTGLDLNKKPTHIPYSYKEKKEQKRIIYK